MPNSISLKAIRGLLFFWPDLPDLPELSILVVCPCRALPVSFFRLKASIISLSSSAWLESSSLAAALSSAVAELQPFRVDYPLVFREERHDPTFDEWNPPAHSRVLDPRTREIDADDIIDLMNKLYGYDPQWRPLPYERLRP